MSMKIYLVRHIETKEVQGIFWGKNVAEIWDIMDEIADPSEFEFASLKSGALFTQAPIGEGRVAFQWAIDDRADSEDPPPFNWAGFEGSEVFTEQLHCQSELKWRPFDFSEEGVGLIARIVRHIEKSEEQASDPEFSATASRPASGGTAQ